MLTLKPILAVKISNSTLYFADEQYLCHPTWIFSGGICYKTVRLSFFRTTSLKDQSTFSLNYKKKNKNCRLRMVSTNSAYKYIKKHLNFIKFFRLKRREIGGLQTNIAEHGTGVC